MRALFPFRDTHHKKTPRLLASTRIITQPPDTGGGGGGTTTAPTYPDAQNLAEGTGTRSLPAVTTAAGDYLVVEIIAEANTVGESYPPTCPGLTLTVQNDAGTGASNDV